MKYSQRKYKFGMKRQLAEDLKQSTISFTPAQAFALRILYTDYINNPTCYLGNKLHILAVEVHKQFI